MSRIVKLEVENIKRLKAVTIEPNGNVVVVGGMNGQGKSSTLDAIWYALGGQRAMPSEPLRKGQAKGFSRLTLDTGLVITRTVTENGTTLKVESADGAVYKTPQALIDRMVGAISFDPMAFARMEPKKQLETLRELVQLDTSDLDKERQDTYDHRTTVNRKLKELEDQLAATKPIPDAPAKELSATDLLEKLQAAQKVHKEQEGWLHKISRLDDQIETLTAELVRMKEELAERKKELAHAKKQLRPQLPDLTEIATAIGQIDTVNAAVRSNKQRAELVDRIAKGREVQAELTAKLQALDGEKESRIATAKFPVSGLAFGESGVRFNGVPFEQCSSAEQTRVSVAMALAMNPELRVLLIRDGSLLDENNLRTVAEMAQAADAQVWIEAVTTDAGKCAVIIEDGEVKATPA